MKIFVILFIFLLGGCVSNAPFRSSDGTCVGHWWGCGKSYEVNPGYDLGFVEFTERGNDFSPSQTSELLHKISEKSKTEDLAVIVFVHGWKHNASTEDENVISFRNALDFLARSGATGDKKILGIYIGWRGMTFQGLQLENLTFWDRKAVAEEVGRGGVTNFLTDLEYIVGQKNKNFMLTVGHSFGAAITLSALHDTLLDKMKTAERTGTLKPFGDGVVLLNPAIEANQALLLKESSMRIGAKHKPIQSIMYVVSSRADLPTNFAFPLGQIVGVNARWKQEVIQRDYFGIPYALKEVDLDDQTVGNYSLFTTGVMNDIMIEPTAELKPALAIEQPPLQKSLLQTRALTLRSSNIANWGFTSYCSPSNSFFTSAHMPCFANDPIDFISAPESFIKNHNDVFNKNVIALLSAIVHKSLSEKQGATLGYCANNKKFDFGKCFAYYFEKNKDIPYDN